MVELKFVDVGEGITSGHIQKWLVNDGDVVKEDQALVNIETDKAVVSIPAPTGGKIKILKQNDTDVNVGDVIATIGEVEVAAPQPQPTQVPQRQQATPHSQSASATTASQVPASAQPLGETREIIAAPAVRKLASDLGVDLSHVKGTGPGGRILIADVRASAQTSHVASQHIEQEHKEAPASGFSTSLESQHSEEIERVPLSQTRKAIARNMEASWTIPRAVHMDLADASALVAKVDKEKSNVEKLGIKLTFLPFIIKATIEALKENPHFNASYDPKSQEIIVKKYYNIGLAAEAPDGLKVIVIKGADHMSIVDIAKKIGELSEKVKNQTISLEDMKDSTFTITNIGSLGGGFLSVPMINYPDVAILGIHLIRDMPIVNNGKIVIGKVLPFSISFDHRVVDGAEAVRFGNSFIKYIQDPDFLEMLS